MDESPYHLLLRLNETLLFKAKGIKAQESAYFQFFTHIQVSAMYSRELLKDLHITIQCLKKELAGSDPEKVEIAQEAYAELLDDFYEEHQDIMISEQWEATKEDPDYFLVLIQLAYHYQNQTTDGGEEEQSDPFFDWNLFTRI